MHLIMDQKIHHQLKYPKSFFFSQIYFSIFVFVLFLQSEDISYLKQEITLGEKDLQRVADLRDECIRRTWSHENIQNQYKNSQLNELPISLQIKNQSTLDSTFQPSSCK